MSTFCPIIQHKVTYLDCQECEDKECMKKKEERKEDVKRNDFRMQNNQKKE